MSAVKQSRRVSSSFSSLTASSMAKGQSSSCTQRPKKRAPLADVTNKQQPSKSSASIRKGPRITSFFSSSSDPCQSKISKSREDPPSRITCSNSSKWAKLDPISKNNISDTTTDKPLSVEESTSACDSVKTPALECEGSNGKASTHLLRVAGYRDVILNVDTAIENPQLCASMAREIYEHLKESESKKQPSTNYMERIQKELTPGMRAILIDWLVEVAEEYRLMPETLYLAVNYIDRYLSGNPMSKQRLQLLGVACMMIASKYEEICAPQVEEFCYITDNTYYRDEVIEMESLVLKFLKFELTAPTAKCFLRRYVRVAQAGNNKLAMQFDCLASCITELCLIEYGMLTFKPSHVAASAVFLAKFILHPSKTPWDQTLSHYTQYEPPDLETCVMKLHELFRGHSDAALPAIRDKYSQHKYKFVAKKYCPPTIPQHYFHHL